MPELDPTREPEVVVIGDDAAAHAAAWKLASEGVAALRVDLKTAPLPERLGTLAPEFFDLAPPLKALRDALPMRPINAVRFLDGDKVAATKEPGSGIEGYKKGEPVAYVTSSDALCREITKLADDAGAGKLSATAEKTEVQDVDAEGVTLYVAGKTLKPKLLIVVDPLPTDLEKALQTGPASGSGDPFHAVYDLQQKVKEGDGLTMSLDLDGQLGWGWLLTLDGRSQLCVQIESGDPQAALQKWMAILVKDGQVKDETINARSMQAMRLPLGGALRRDVVARRTLLAGPAGGFYSASGEEFYPSVWSGLIAAEAAMNALGERHVQDALGEFRGMWGATLGDYLRGPQQNLRFLLPLVFNNPAMTDRLAEAILRGQSLVK